MSPSGICWPVDKDTGKMSTTATGHDMVAASLDGVNPELAAKTRAEKKWRDNYADHLFDLVQACAESPQAALENARAGMAFCYDNFSFNRSGKCVPLTQVLAAPSLDELCCGGPMFESVEYQGPSVSQIKPMTIKVHGTVRSSDEFLKIAENWTTAGVIEPSALEAWRWTAANGVKADGAVASGLKDTIFVVFGAGAAIGPFEPLMKTGATVAAVDLPRRAVWERLMALAKQSPGAKVLAPRDNSTGELGADLIMQAPEVARWVCSLDPSKRLVLGSFGYTDGANFVRLALAMDLVKMLVLKHRANKNILFSYLCSPTDAFLVGEETRAGSRARYEAFSLPALVRPIIQTATLGASLQPNYADLKAKQLNASSNRVVDCFVVQQGPNYALAKRVQHWRAVLARDAGVPVSSNVAPASATESVTKNALLAAGYGGAQFFPPIEIFEPKLTNHIMLLSLYHDIFNSQSCAYPSYKMDNPLDLFAIGAVHGGMQRLGYRLRTVLEIAVLLHYLDKYKTPLFVSAGALYGFNKMRSKL